MYPLSHTTAVVTQVSIFPISLRLINELYKKLSLTALVVHKSENKTCFSVKYDQSGLFPSAFSQSQLTCSHQPFRPPGARRASLYHGTNYVRSQDKSHCKHTIQRLHTSKHQLGRDSPTSIVPGSTNWKLYLLWNLIFNYNTNHIYIHLSVILIFEIK